MMRSPAFAVLLLAAPALATPPAVYVNDVRVDGLRGMTLNGVDVRFEDNGDIRIIAPKYKIAPMGAVANAPAPAPSAIPPAPARGKRFFIVPAPQLRVGAAQWEVEVLVNGSFVAKLRSRDPAPYVEISPFLHKGQNQIVYMARKEPGERVSVSADDVFELQLGDGDIVDGRVSITKLNGYRLSAAEAGARKSEFALEVP